MKIRRMIFNGVASAIFLAMLPVGVAHAMNNYERSARYPVQVKRTIWLNQLNSKKRVQRQVSLRRGRLITISKYNQSVGGYIVNARGLKDNRFVYVMPGRRANWFTNPRLRPQRKVRIRKRTPRFRRFRRGTWTRKNRTRNRQQVLRAQFRRSNNQRALKRSGFVDVTPMGGRFIFNLYAPNDRRAVVPKKLNVNRLGWAQGLFGQPKPRLYVYKPNLRGWILYRK